MSPGSPFSWLSLNFGSHWEYNVIPCLGEHELVIFGSFLGGFGFSALVGHPALLVPEEIKEDPSGFHRTTS
jgi:hypothetical protein